jgi:hypothetical protein
MTTNNKGRNGGDRATPKTSNNHDDTALAQELSHIKKPEIDMLTWAALGNAVKPSRTDRRQKKSWMRAT